MKGKHKLLAIACASVIAVGAAAIVAGEFGLSNHTFGTKAATFEYDASKVTTRRIYFVNNDNGGYWYRGFELSAQVWYGEGKYSGFVNAHEIYGNYYYYVDFTSTDPSYNGPSLGGDLHFQLRAKTGIDTYAYTEWCYNLPSLDKKGEDVVYVNNNKGMSLGTVNVGDNATIIACVLDHYSSCAVTYSSGYNGYPQLKVGFLDPNAVTIADKGATEKCEEGNTPIADKIAMLDRMYSTNGWTVTQNN